jgi:4'-phosphopantetheinyl transferase
VRTRTRALLHEVLSGYLGIPAAEVVIGTEPEGRPLVVDTDRPGWPRFSVSHAGPVMLIAVSRAAEVGIDVEDVRRDVDWQEVADAFFAPAELAAIARRPPEDRRTAFFDCWVRKEAYAKALGRGFRRTTKDFIVPLGDAGGVVHDLAPAAARVATWFVRPLAVGAGYTAALAVDADVEVTIRYPASGGRR